MNELFGNSCYCKKKNINVGFFLLVIVCDGILGVFYICFCFLGIEIDCLVVSFFCLFVLFELCFVSRSGNK